MKRDIYGRKAGSENEFALLISSDGASTGGVKGDPDKLREFEIASTRRAVATLREKGVEGYVMFEGDALQYVFTPDTDFVYPAQQTVEMDEVFKIEVELSQGDKKIVEAYGKEEGCRSFDVALLNVFLNGLAELRNNEELPAVNTKAMDYLMFQVNGDDHSMFQAGRFHGACEALCMAGIITAEQWQQLEELKNANDLKHANRVPK